MDAKPALLTTRAAPNRRSTEHRSGASTGRLAIITERGDGTGRPVPVGGLTVTYWPLPRADGTVVGAQIDAPNRVAQPAEEHADDTLGCVICPTKKADRG
jgi:hypothetical protein